MGLEGLISRTPGGDILRVREVWEDNLDEEMGIIRAIVEQYCYIAMDTEFPGAAPRPRHRAPHAAGLMRRCGSRAVAWRRSLSRGPAPAADRIQKCAGCRCARSRGGDPRC